MSIYFVRVCPDGPIKIGVTSLDVKQRLFGLRVGCPWELELIGSIEGDLNDEASLHKLLAPHRMSGEWFSPHPDVLKTIDDALSGRLQRSSAPARMPGMMGLPPLTAQEYLAHLSPISSIKDHGLYLDLPPDLSLLIHNSADYAQITVQDLIIDILRDAFPINVSRETSSLLSEALPSGL